DGELKCRSKGAVLNVFAPEKMFIPAVEVAGSLDLKDGWTYPAEYLARPKHNTLAYDRAAQEDLMILDINTRHQHYLPYAHEKAEAKRLGLECVPKLYEGMIEDLTFFRSLMETVSCLGGQKIEGVVIKNYKRFTPDGKAMFGKFVSEAFKEVNDADFRERNPKQ